MHENFDLGFRVTTFKITYVIHQRLTKRLIGESPFIQLPSVLCANNDVTSQHEIRFCHVWFQQNILEE